MSALVVTILIQHLLLPLFFIVWLWKDRYLSRLRWAASVFLAGSYVAFIVVVGAWSWVGYPLRAVFPLLFVLAAVSSFRRVRALPVRAGRSWVGAIYTGSRVAIGGLFLPLALWGLAGYGVEEEALELAFPLRGGTYVVGQGGSTPIVNGHNPHPAQRYALDILKVKTAGLRARGLYPDDLERYAIFGDAVVSPCQGTVAAARDGLPDLTPPASDRQSPAGNFVAVECGGATIYLAHLLNGSLQVQTGQNVETGQPTGRVGNSGNTTEPHLHMHAGRGPYAGERSSQRGMPMRFGGRFLVRNSLIGSRD
jgi:hypothetical protein